jgi:hypothetical protein
MNRGGNPVTRAIVYMPEIDYAHSDRCFAYLRERGYEFKGIVRDWKTVARMLGDGEVSVAIAYDRRDIDSDRKPRVEFVSHWQGGVRWDERTRIIPRDVGA